jgi:predicted NodU family carbamoyl transferase
MAELIENTILGINISHDTSIAVVKDGVLVDVFEEERCRRSKYWAPTPGEETRLQSIEQKINTESIDEIVFTSFDRRAYDYNIDKVLSHDRLATREFMKDMTECQLSRERLEDLEDRYVDLFTFAGGSDEDDNGDLLIADELAEHHFDLPEGEYQYNVDHHTHHAWCGFSLAPKDMTDALVITMDGGGCRKRWDDYPTHQEIESIYFGDLNEEGDKQIVPLYQKLSNYRFVADLSEQLPNELYDCLMSTSVDSFTDNDVDYEMVSTPSMGMNFSNLSFALGTDELGRAAGKVMGMASYGSDNKHVYNRYNIGYTLEVDSFEYTCNLIQKAIDYKPDCRNIILSGGFSLNCTNNYKYLSAFPDYQIFVDPIPHDGGTAAGAALQMYADMVQSGGVMPGEEYTKPSVWDAEEEQQEQEPKVHPKIVLKI